MTITAETGVGGHSEEVPAATRNWKRQRTDSPLDPPETLLTPWTFGLQASSTLRKQVSVVLNNPVCGNLLFWQA